VSAWPIRSVEQAGSSRNLWLEEPETGAQWLHKDTVIPSNGVEQGEDWSEVLSTAVAAMLGTPCATTRLCMRNERRGSISRSVRPDKYSLNEGRVILEQVEAPGYFAHTEGKPARDPARPEVKRPGHSLSNIKLALDGVLPPRDFSGSDECTGFDVFSGYMILDALIANRDRHEQNWAVLTPALLGPPEHLSPTYDHASSLGYNLTDDRRNRYIESDTELWTWATRGTAWRFEHSGTPETLVDHAAHAVSLCSEAGADWWRGQLSDLDLGPVVEALNDRAIPAMSVPAARFARELLILNLRRLRDAICRTS
jgi:hypothetical protein